MPRAIVHNPYWDSLGGGERYVATSIRWLLDHGFTVDVCWSRNISEEITSRFGVDISQCTFVPNFKSFGYDVALWVSDGSLPVSWAKQTIIHFQFPFSQVNGKSLLNKFKSRTYKFIVNSRFTKHFVDEEYAINSQVVYPPVRVRDLKPLKKENSILYVGRFSNLTQQKHQDTLIQAFAKLNQKGWRLVLAGGVGVGSEQDYLSKLQSMASGLVVEFVPNPTWHDLVQLYGKAKLFWSASGFGVNQQREPLKVEHFGITVVEAMAAGCVPIITNLGGHPEIVTDTHDGFLWEQIDDLVKITVKLITSPPQLKTTSQQAIKRSKMFATDKFYEAFSAVVGNRVTS